MPHVNRVFVLPRLREQEVIFRGRGLGAHGDAPRVSSGDAPSPPRAGWRRGAGRALVVLGEKLPSERTGANRQPSGNLDVGADARRKAERA